MAVNNRASRISALQKIARKHYQPVKPPARSVLEHLLYACCLEDALFDAADIAFARVQQSFFDWNEVRVTTTVELAEVMSGLPDPAVAAARLKRTLHSMFESHYSFDIDHLRKENLGKAVQRMEKYKGISPFVISYVAQNALGGHSIGIDRSMLNLLQTVGVIDDKEAAKAQVPGLERAIPKTKAIDFFSTVHQLAVAWNNSPFNKDLRAVLLTIDPESQERFPKRARPARKAAAEKKAQEKAAKQELDAANSATQTTEKASTKKGSSKSSPARKPAAGSSGKKKVVEKKTRTGSTKKSAASGRKKSTSTAQKSPAKRLARKKPR
jgi:endonuclease-3